MKTMNIINKLVFVFLLTSTFSFSFSTVTAQNDTMYVMKNGNIVGKYNVNTEVDSVIFYQLVTQSGNTLLAGNWSGTFIGDESGTWTATISESGVVTGTAEVTSLSIKSVLNGNVSSDGKFTATVGTTSLGYNFDGKLNGNSGSGTWKNSSETQSGSWSGTKN